MTTGKSLPSAEWRTMQERCVHRRIEENIRQRIRAGVYLPGSRIPTDLELVEEFGASRLTVARGMNALAGQGWVERTRGRGTFVSAVLPGEEKKNGALSGAIKYISPAFRDDRVPVSFGVLRGVNECVRLASGGLVGIEFYHTVEEELELLRSFRNPDIGGFIIWPSCDPRISAVLAQMRAARFPFVQLDTMAPESEGNFVCSDNFAGGGMMIDHLVSRGYRRIVYITVPLERDSVRERLGGVTEAMMRHRLVFSRRDFIVVPNEDKVRANELNAEHLDFLRAELQALLARPAPERPDAIFCCSDTIALSVWRLLNEWNIRMPEEIALAGFDNIDQTAWSSVSMTTMAQDFYGMGKIASRLLFAAGPQAAEPSSRQYRIRPKLVVRGSTPLRLPSVRSDRRGEAVGE